MKNKRLTLPDIIRGYSLLAMIIYHTLWDLAFIAQCSIPWFFSTGAYIWQQSICWTFILISGFCTGLGHHRLKRGIVILICSLMISVITILVIPDEAVKYGVLCLIASGMLLTVPLDSFFKKIPPSAGLTVCFCTFLITRNIPDGFLGFEQFNIAGMPSFLYQNNLTAYLGFPGADFRSSDYFPVIPWIFLYFSGYFLFLFFKKNDLLKYMSPFNIRFLQWMGRHSLIIYLIHQPVIYGAVHIYLAVSR